MTKNWTKQYLKHLTELYLANTAHLKHRIKTRVRRERVGMRKPQPPTPPWVVSPYRCGAWPLRCAPDAAEPPRGAQQARERPGVAERRLPQDPGAKLQLARRAGSHHPEGEPTGALVPRRSG